jgi:hypothetical protein
MNTSQFLANFYIETNTDADIFVKSNESNVISNRPENNFTVCNITINKPKLLTLLLPQLRDYCKQTHLTLPMINYLEDESNFNELACSMVRVDKIVKNKLFTAPKKVYLKRGVLHNRYPVSSWDDNITLEVCLYVKDNIPVFLVKSALLEKYLSSSFYYQKLSNVEITSSHRIGTHHRPSESLFKKIRILYKHNIQKNDTNDKFEGPTKYIPTSVEPVKEMVVTTAEVELIKEVVMNPESKNNVQDILSFLHDVITSVVKINELRKTKRIDYDPKNQTSFSNITSVGYVIHGGDKLSHISVSINVNGGHVMTLKNHEDLVKFIDSIIIVETTKVSFETLLKAE